ncbi:hypothetical protein B0H11DRAFT_2248713 [Mycena galericulata]|nr:hypothetical protein B0H11DRAFT_2248713 [Mycena galericulata]
MPGKIKQLVERFPQRAAARESGNSGSPLNWFLRGYISRIRYCRRPYLNFHGFLVAPVTIMLPNGEEKDIAHFILERFAEGGRIEGLWSAFEAVPADDQAFICEGARPNLGNIVAVAVVPLPHRLSHMELVAVVQTVYGRWKKYSLFRKNCYWLCATLLDALHLRASGTSVPTSPPPSSVAGKLFFGAPGVTTSMQEDIGKALSSLHTALRVALRRELQGATPLSSLVTSHSAITREWIRAAHSKFRLRAEVARLRTEQATLLARMREAAVCLHPTAPLVTLKLPGPSNVGLAGVEWRVRQRPGEDEEAVLRVEIYRLQVDNAALLSSVLDVIEDLHDMVMEAEQIEDEDEQALP